MPSRVIRDPDHPDFPHGTERGRARDCTCRRCVHAATTANSRRELMRMNGQTPGRTQVPAGPTRERLLALLAVPGWGRVGNVCQITGLTVEGIRFITNPMQQTVRWRTERAVLGVTEADLRREALFIPIDVARQRCRALQAQGWRLADLATILGYHDVTAPPFLFGKKRTHVTRAVWDAIVAACDLVGDRDGGDEVARRTARNLGYYPLHHYDDDGVLNPRTVEGHPWEVADRACRIRLEILHAVLHGASAATAAVTAAEMAGVDKSNEKDWTTAVAAYDRAATRAVSKLGLVGVDRTKVTGIPPRLQELRDRVRECRAPGSDVDHVVLLLDLDVAPQKSIPAGHPSRAACRAARRAAVATVAA